MNAAECPRCGSTRWLPIVRGFPTPEMSEAAERGEIALGGCLVFDDDPDRQCAVCALPEGAAEWNGDEWTGADESGDRLPKLSYCSDVDGVRFAVANATANLAGWSLEVADSHRDGATRTSTFELDTVFGTPPTCNLIGYGEPTEAWIAVADHGTTAVALISPDGSRIPLR